MGSGPPEEGRTLAGAGPSLRHPGPAPSARPWREGAVVLAGLGTATVLAWLYVVSAAGGLGGRGRTMGASLEFGFALSMWVVMMAGMMLPSAAPMVVTFAAASRRHAGYLARTAAFVGAYLAVWTGFSLLAAAAQWALRSAGLVSASGAAQPLLAGALLVGAGAYQLSPLKNACLRRCRTPLGFLMTEWRPGRRGAAVMGLRHGVECVLCCWSLMALMFVVGTMDLRWMAALTLLMVAEKTLPGGERVGRAVGVACLAWGGWWVLGALA